MCKTYLINTFGITERSICSVIQTRTSGSGISIKVKRGKHSNHSKADIEIIDSVKEHINSIPRVESHYQRANTSREFIDGGLCIAEMHRHYTKEQGNIGKTAANYDFILVYSIKNLILDFSILKKTSAIFVKGSSMQRQVKKLNWKMIINCTKKKKI